MREESRLKALLATYRVTMRMSVLEQLQYRATNYFYMIGMVTEPVIYLVVWTTIARSEGGSIEGYTPGTFAAYYIVWTLVRNMNIVLTPYAWEFRIKDGELAGALLRPLHPLHFDLGYFAGWKVVAIFLWLPIAFVLSLAFRPELSPSALQCVVFFLAIWGAYLIRTVNLWLLGMVTFWTTRGSALFEAYMVAELLLSGRLVPMDLMPGWVEGLAWGLPFRWTFGYPITALVGPITTAELLTGLAMQALWVCVGLVGIRAVWPRAVRQFSAVGG